MGGFCITALGMWEYCHWKRRKEQSGMKMAVELLNEKRLEKAKKQMEEKRLAKMEADRVAREAEEAEARRRTSWTNLNNYKFW